MSGIRTRTDIITRQVFYHCANVTQNFGWKLVWYLYVGVKLPNLLVRNTWFIPQEYLVWSLPVSGKSLFLWFRSVDSWPAFHREWKWQEEARETGNGKVQSVYLKIYLMVFPRTHWISSLSFLNARHNVPPLLPWATKGGRLNCESKITAQTKQKWRFEINLIWFE